MFLIITSTCGQLFNGVKIDDLEWPWTLETEGFTVFFKFSAAVCTFQEWIAPKWLEINLDNLRMKFLPQNIHFNRINFDLLNSSSLLYGGLKFGYFFQAHCYFIAYCTLIVTGPLLSRPDVTPCKFTYSNRCQVLTSVANLRFSQGRVGGIFFLSLPSPPFLEHTITHAWSREGRPHVQGAAKK